jgi:hypothetical protein
MFDLLRDLLADDERKNTANVPENACAEGDNGTFPARRASS